MKNRISKIIAMAIGCWLVAGCAGNNNGSNTNTQKQVQMPATETLANDGKTLFEDKCEACHGFDGTAGIANAANLQTSRLDSTTIIKTITDGKNAMPSFKNKLTLDEIEKVADYVHVLRK